MPLLNTYENTKRDKSQENLKASKVRVASVKI